MITTVTLNPAVDKTCTTARLLPGTVNRMDSVKNLAGGKGINVTKVLRVYGYPVKALGFLGGYTGRFIEEYVEEIGAECRFTHITGETRTSTNLLSEDGYVTELLEPGAEISKEELEAFYCDYEKEIADSSLVIFSGSVPKGVPSSIYKELKETADRLGKKVLLDTSGEFLREGVASLPFMIKPNVKELEVLIGRKLKERAEILHAALSLHMQGISHILVSMGDKGMIYVTDKKAYYAKAPKLKAVNTVGCGDSAVAAFAMGIEEQKGPEDILKLCVAVSAANATTLESGVIPKATADALFAEIVVEQLV